MPIDDYPGDSPVGTSGGKFILIQVPDFNAGSTGIAMSSYLRIGATDPTVPPGVTPATTPDPWGEDLAAIVHGFSDDLRPRDGGASVGQPAPHLSDENEASLDSTTARREESFQLHTKGGWRDHSDGNRITTTRGDKVEIIRGNYKLIVLGRSDIPTAPPGPTNPTGWANVTGMELAGGNVDDAGNDLGFGMLADPDPTGALGLPLDPSRDPTKLVLQTSYEWFMDSDTTWAWTETTTVGSPNVPPGNNRVVSNTWIDYQETNLGSAGKRVSSILASTYAATLTQITNVSGTLTQTTNAGDVETSTTGSNKVSNTTAAPIVTSLTEAGMQETTQVLGANIIANLVGATIEIDMGGVAFTAQVVGAALNYFAAPVVMDVHSYVHVDNHTGSHVDHHSGMHFDLHDGMHATIDASPLVTKIETNGSMTLANGQTISVKGYDVAAHQSTLTATEALAIRLAQSHMTL